MLPAGKLNPKRKWQRPDTLSLFPNSLIRFSYFSVIRRCDKMKIRQECLLIKLPGRKRDLGWKFPCSSPPKYRIAFNGCGNIMSVSKLILSCGTLQLFPNVHYKNQYPDIYLHVCIFAFIILIRLITRSWIAKYS